MAIVSLSYRASTQDYAIDDERLNIFFTEYLGKINPCSEFVFITDTTDFLNSLHYNNHYGKPCVFYKKTSYGFVGLLNDFFKEANDSEEKYYPNQSKYLFLYDRNYNTFSFFINDINREKTPVDSVTENDLFGKYGINLLLFDSLYNLKAIGKIYKNKKDWLPDIYIKQTDSLYALASGSLKLFYESFSKQRLSNIAETNNILNRFIASTKLNRKERNIFKYNFFVSQWCPSAKF